MLLTTFNMYCNLFLHVTIILYGKIDDILVKCGILRPNWTISEYR